MSGLRPLPARKLLKVLHEFGWHEAGQRGSHLKLRGPGGAMLVIPVHPGKDIKGFLAQSGVPSMAKFMHLA